MTSLRRLCLIASLALTTGIAAYADPETDSLRHGISDARAHHDTPMETIWRERLMVSFYNRLMYDSLIAEAGPQMEHFQRLQDWNHYYYMWRMLVSAYIYSGRNNTALREVKRMYEDAQQRGDEEGVAAASHTMGLAYQNMGYYEEARKAMERSIKLMEGKGNEPFMMVSLYGDYCQVLTACKDYEALSQATDGWWDALMLWGRGREQTDEETASMVFATYVYVAKAMAARGKGDYDTAETWLRKATLNAKRDGEDNNDGWWHHVASEWSQLELARGNYREALHYNDEAMRWIRQRNIQQEIVGAEEQRAEILTALGLYQEAATLWENVLKTTKEQNLQDAKDQLSEMNSLFQLDEKEMEQQRLRTRTTVIIASLIVLALLLLLLFRYFAARRLAHANNRLAVALDRAQESDRMKTSFIQHVSHEIRTPLNIITGFTQVLNTPGYDIDDEQRTEMLASIQHNTDQMTLIVNELIDLASIESATSIPTQNKKTTVYELCQKAILASGIHSTPDVEFLLDNAMPADAAVTTDAESAVKILTKLLQNAMKFTTKGHIRLHCTQDDDLLTMAIEDTGCGIPEEARERIFNTFEKADQFQEGIGLGLSLARTLARRLGGDVVLQQSSPKGSTFIVTLPINAKEG